jgi:phage shock protein PspC (stress-responsive transcriptional regulator)
MKKTIKINLNGLVYNLDEDAYQVLKDYLDQISAYFKDLDGGEEIISDIESRLAEIFQSKISDRKQVISLKDVHEAIEIMGKADEIIDSEVTNGQDKEKRSYSSRRQYRKLYRDPENAIFGGVAAGLAAYFNMETWIIRLIWVILFIPFQVMGLLYIILWIVVPRALTPAQKLEMRGEKVTVRNIEKTVKEEYENVRDNISRVKKSREFEKTKNVLDEIFHVVGRIIIVFLKILLIIIGISLIMSGLAALTGLTGLFFFSHSLFPFRMFEMHFYSLHEFLSFFMHPGTLGVFAVSLFLVILIPLVALIYGGLKLILRFKANDRVIALIGLVLWIISIMFLVTTALFESINLSAPGRVSTEQTLAPLHADTLIVVMNPSPGIKGFNDEWYYGEDDDWHVLSEYDRIYNKIDLDIEPSDDENFRIKVTNSSRERFNPIFPGYPGYTEHQWTRKGDTLVLNPFYCSSKIPGWQAPEAEVIIKIPEGKYIHLDLNTKHFLDDIKGIPGEQVPGLAGKTVLLFP